MFELLLSDVIDIYKADRVAKGNKKATVYNEQRTLRSLLVEIGNVHVAQIGPKQMDRFWVAHQNWAPSTFNLAKTQLTTFFKWCAERGYMPRHADPMEGVKKRRIPKKNRAIIPQKEWDRVLDCATSPRDRAIVAIGLYLFLRVSEIEELRWRDIDFDNKLVYIYRRKTDTFDQLPMCEELEHELRKWKLEYGSKAGEVPHPEWYVVPAYTPPLFRGRVGGGLYLERESVLIPGKKLTGITERVKAVLREAGLDAAGEGGHTLRRSGATALYLELSRLGHDRAIRMCQAMLGHAHIQSTEIYLALDLERKARNDLLAGKRMFAGEDAPVIKLEGLLDGEADTGTL